jgi:hypothetical protein
MKYTFLQYEFRNKWIHTSWCDKFFAADKEHFDRLRDAIFGLKDGSRELIYPEAAARMKQSEQAKSRQILSLYASLGAFNNLI